MQEIRIQVKDGWNYSFNTNDHETLLHDNRKCSYCEDIWFDTVYCYIIDCLKEAGLLHEDFEEICCCCLILRHFGLMDLRHKLIGFTYIVEEDYLIAEFSCKGELIDGVVKYRTLMIRIHDWSKINHWN